jgi:hypothetical protein
VRHHLRGDLAPIGSEQALPDEDPPPAL